MRYFRTNWRIPLAVISVVLLSSIVSSFPRFFENLRTSITNASETTEETLALPTAWESELSTHWSRDYIAEAVADGLIDSNQKNFRPNDYVNRAEMAMLLARVIAGSDSAAWIAYRSNTFCDVVSTDWFADAVMTIYDAEFVRGYAADACDAGIVFQPGQNLTRAEALKVVLGGHEISVEDGAASFKDTSLHWGEKYIATGANLGVVGGYDDGTFRPDAPITRAEFMKILIAAKDAAAESAASVTEEEVAEETSNPAEGEMDPAEVVVPYEFNDDIPSI